MVYGNRVLQLDAKMNILEYLGLSCVINLTGSRPPTKVANTGEGSVCMAFLLANTVLNVKSPAKACHFSLERHIHSIKCTPSFASF